MSEPLPPVDIYALGVLTSSVCAVNELTPEQVADAVNQEAPAGEGLRWAIANDTHFATGQTNPCPCDRFPKERRHWLLNC